MTALAIACLALAALGCLYLAYATIAAAGFDPEAPRQPSLWPSVTVLKPLRGDEPRLARNLASFCRQNYPSPVQLIFGVQSAEDAAIDVVRRVQAECPGLQTRLVVEPAIHGANRKISNLINMTPAIEHELIVLADSDIEVPPHYLRSVAAALDRPGVGGVTCLYYGAPEGGLWAKLSALAIDAHFLPGVLVGLRLGLATPCFGSTIAMRRRELDAIGGFDRFSNTLADDYAIGAALRALGLSIAIPRLFVGHTCSEGSLGELWRHEVRLARTIRTVDPIGHFGSVITHPLAFSLLAALAGAPIAGVLFAALAILCRVVFLSAMSRCQGLPRQDYWLVPLSDLLSFAIFVWSLFGQGLTWRGENFRVARSGAMTSLSRTNGR